jgi:hypothetical protein
MRTDWGRFAQVWALTGQRDAPQSPVPMPGSSLFSGPVLPDVEKAAAAGVTLGGVAGFVVVSMIYPLSQVQKILMWSTYSGMLAAVFGVALVLFGRIF